MYNSMYEDYIRTVLGYPSQRNLNCNNCSYGNNDMVDDMEMFSQNNINSELEECYPEIYKIIYPMIRKACSSNYNLNSRDEIERVTDEIYNAIEEDNQINVNINLGNNIKSSINSGNTVNTANVENNRSEVKNENRENRERKEVRRAPNQSLRDLIKILLLRELLGRPNPRPPMRPRPPRPPMGRPPIMPRTYNQLPYDIYEY